MRGNKMKGFENWACSKKDLEDFLNELLTHEDEEEGI